MLDFYNCKILFNCEVGTRDKYLISSCEDFCDQQYLQQVLPSCTVYEKLQATDLMGRQDQIAMSIPQFVQFIKDWFDKVTPTISGIDIDNWILTYLQGLASIAERGEYLTDQQLFPAAVIRKVAAAINQLRAYQLPSQHPAVDFSGCDRLQPEITWAVFDRFNGSGMYRQQVDLYIQQNINRLKYQISVNSILGASRCCKIDIPLDSWLTFDLINWKNPQSVLYLYVPFCDNKVRTNFQFLQQIWETYQESL